MDDDFKLEDLPLLSYKDQRHLCCGQCGTMFHPKMYRKDAEGIGYFVCPVCQIVSSIPGF